jgi:hypothetical protein
MKVYNENFVMGAKLWFWVFLFLLMQILNSVFSERLDFVE